MAADYPYVSTWQLQAPIEPIWAAISHLEQLPAWYPGVQQVQTLTPGDPDAVGSRVRYLWDVQTTRPWMNLVAPIARSLFTWNSRGVMLQAGQGLARHLEVPLVDARFTAPPWPRGRRLGWAALAAAGGWLLVRRGRALR
jgi:hypothetical protein